MVVTAPANGTVTPLADGTVDYTHDGTTTYVDSFTYNIIDFLGNVSNDAIVDLTITSSVPVDLTPSTGNLIVGDNPLWATKGYRFTALVDFTITGGAWLLQMPNTGYVELTVYDSNGGALAVGTQDLGDGTSRWYQSDLFYTFTAGSTYTVAWYTSQAATSTFDRKDNPSYGYAVNGKLDNVTHYSSLQMGDNAANVYPDALNTWAPFQRLDIVP